MWAILQALGYRHSAHYMTDEQIVTVVCCEQLASDSGIRTRRSELVRAGLVEEAGGGKTAAGRPCRKWRLTSMAMATMDLIRSAMRDGQTITLGEAIHDYYENGG